MKKRNLIVMLLLSGYIVFAAADILDHRSLRAFLILANVWWVAFIVGAYVGYWHPKRPGDRS